jgi:hypothetical protein
LSRNRLKWYNFKVDLNPINGLVNGLGAKHSLDGGLGNVIQSTDQSRSVLRDPGIYNLMMERHTWKILI